MKLTTYRFIVLSLVLLQTGCGNAKKQATGQADQTATTTVALAYPDSVEQRVNTNDNRLDMKMKRKVYEPTPGTLVTLQKWFENGDTTKLVKLRREILTGRTKLEVIQYHFLNQNLVLVHDYSYRKQCGTDTAQCMTEAKFFFRADTLFSATNRNATGTPTRPPVIEGATFMPFRPTPAQLAAQRNGLVAIEKKYATLPFPKPRPEQGSPVR